VKDALHRAGDFALLLGHDVGLGLGILGAKTTIVGRVWGFSIGPLAIFWTKNVTREAATLHQNPYEYE